MIAEHKQCQINTGIAICLSLCAKQCDFGQTFFWIVFLLFWNWFSSTKHHSVQKRFWNFNSWPIRLETLRFVYGLIVCLLFLFSKYDVINKTSNAAKLAVNKSCCFISGETENLAMARSQRNIFENSSEPYKNNKRTENKVISAEVCSNLPAIQNKYSLEFTQKLQQELTQLRLIFAVLD